MFNNLIFTSINSCWAKKKIKDESMGEMKEWEGRKKKAEERGKGEERETNRETEGRKKKTIHWEDEHMPGLGEKWAH